MELGAFGSMLAMQMTASESTTGKKLVAIGEAGYLDEYVWTDRHREAWGDKAPDGLKLSAFKKWRKKNLKDFSVHDIGSRRVRATASTADRVSRRPLKRPYKRVRLQIRILLM